MSRICHIGLRYNPFFTCAIGAVKHPILVHSPIQGYARTGLGDIKRVQMGSVIGIQFIDSKLLNARLTEVTAVDPIFAGTAPVAVVAM